MGLCIDIWYNSSVLPYHQILYYEWSVTCGESVDARMPTPNNVGAAVVPLKLLNEKRASGSPETTEENSHDGIVEALQGQYLINDELRVKLHHVPPL